MPQYPRYAIYFVPPAGSELYRFGASLLGYDAFTGLPLPFADSVETEVENWKLITTDPRKYGFHATLKAPISLASGKTEQALIAAIGDFAQTPRAIPVIVPTVRAIGSFIAVVPDSPSPQLQKFAADAVMTFDHFRAPLTAEDRARRNVSALTDEQLTSLDRWGYPYVFEQFRFHLTLSGSLPTEQRTEVLDILRERLAALNLQSVYIDHVALLRQDDATTAFSVISYSPLHASREGS